MATGENGTDKAQNGHRVAYVISLMRENLQQRLTPQVMAEWVNITPARLRQLFQAQLEISPMQTLRRMRMEKARELLETTYLSVKEVTARVGVGDVSHFVRDFKRAYGVTPAEHRGLYRESLRRKDANGRLRFRNG